MLNSMEYIKNSIETNLFFLRIMKEHLIFLSASLPSTNADLVKSLLEMKNMYEQLLMSTVSLVSDNIDPRTMSAGDMVTPYTLNAEIVTQNLTGIPINTDITKHEMNLINMKPHVSNAAMEQTVHNLNEQIIEFLKVTIEAQKSILEYILSCKLFSSLFPLMLDHTTREAEHYMEHLVGLQNKEDMMDSHEEMAMHVMFWNEIMAEHSKFIRDMLDPSEDQLKQRANRFAMEFDNLTRDAKAALVRLEILSGVTRASAAATNELSKFKEHGTIGILECKIRSVIYPLLSDHVLREANHYLKSLKIH